MSQSVKLAVALCLLLHVTTSVLASHRHRKCKSSCKKLQHTYVKQCLTACPHILKKLETHGCRPKNTCEDNGHRCLPTNVECTGADGDCVDGGKKCCIQANTTLTCNTPQFLTCRSACDDCFEVMDADNGGCPDGNVCCKEKTDIRLVGGVQTTDKVSGRVEIFYRGHWMTVCDDFWSPGANGEENALVTCRQLGFTNVTSANEVRSTFGAGSGFILLDNVQCTGEEANLLACPSNDLGENNCPHNDDIGVECHFGP